MSMSDWNDKQNGINMVLSSTQAHGGSKSLRIKCIQTDEVIKILDKSEADNPVSANFQFWTYFSACQAYRVSALAVFFRYQDTENFYAADFRGFCSGGNCYINFRKRVASAYTNCTETDIGNVTGAWHHFKVLFCEVANIVYCLIYQEVSGEWVLKKEDTLSKEWANGALGIGAITLTSGLPCDNCYVYLDDTTIYYT